MRVEHVDHACSQPKAAVLFLHGLGASGYDFMPWVQTYANDLDIHWRMPHAPARPVTWLEGQVAPAWFDLFEASTRSKEDLAGLKLAAAMVKDQLQQLSALGLPYNKIFLMGFSQGAALALYAGLRLEFSLGGIAAFSGYLPSRKDLCVMAKQHVWLSHGRLDQVLPTVFHEVSVAALLASNNVELSETIYQDMAHELNHNCSLDFFKWFQTRINNESS